MTPKILIVDDEPLNLTTLEAFLAGEGYELHFAANGYDACAKAQIEQPDLILLDVMMPELDGFAVTRRIRADPVIGRIPIILITALDDDRSRLEGLHAGADDFLSKPCRREEIRARVRTVASLNRFRIIAEQRARFERLFALAPGGIVLVDPQGTVVAANARAEVHRTGRPVVAPFDKAAAEIVRATLSEAWRAGESTAHEVRHLHGGAERIFHVRAVIVPDGGTHLAMLAFDDITAEVHAREALQKVNAELDELVRARTRQLEESNGMLLSYANFVSHDLRSPLTVVKGYLSLVEEGVVPLAEAAPVVSQAYQGTIMMQELIQNMLQLAQDEHDRTRQPAPVAVDPAPVIRRLALRMRDLFSRHEPHFEFAPLPPVGVSAVLIERVFYNLLANALKYSAQQRPPRIEIGAAGSADAPVIFVRDNGVGFDARDTDKLFREFTRLPTASGTDGFGLGLSLVARLLRAHGGRIWAESVAGAGATFFVQFPPPAASPVEPRLAGAAEPS
ncbi:MAG TPA: response regulator [Opitutaceae bacterium]|nr:response regulator [Opitutaceae bacterium]